MKYKILVIALLLKNNKMGNAGDEVTADQLTDSVENLIAGNYIEEVKAPEPTAEELQAQADQAKKREQDAAKGALDAANAALVIAQNNAASAAPELKEAADAAVVNAQEAVNAAQSAYDALVAPSTPAKKK
jgi:hypothetical protein